MSSKSRHGKRKYAQSKKRRKERQVVPAVSVQQPIVSQVSETAAPHEVSIPSASIPGKTVTPIATRYPYIVTELRRIGILAGIILVILVILAAVFS